MDSDAGLTPYELRVKRNIEENQRVLKSLGLLNSNVNRRGGVKKAVRRSSTVVKSRSSIKPNDESPASSYPPTRRTRRSSSLLKAQGFDEDDDVYIPDEENTPPYKKPKIVREHVFGPIEGVSVGDWWMTRVECAAAGVHRPTVAGISGHSGEGCYSIALSGGYEDDVDYGEYFTYTGSGGRDLKGTKTNPKNLRTAPQTKDQVLEGLNAALALNTENHRPVRVIRGYKLPSPYAPEEGYRYDGLYTVERCWTATGLSGFKVYKYALKRLPGQDPPPWETDGSDLRGPTPQNGPASENGAPEREDGLEDQIIISESIASAECLKIQSKHSPNMVKRTENGGGMPVNDVQMTPPNSSDEFAGDGFKGFQSSPERNNSYNSDLNSEMLKYSESSTNSFHNIPERDFKIAVKCHALLGKKRKLLSNVYNYNAKTRDSQKSPKDSLNAVQNVSKDNGANEAQGQSTPKIKRVMRSSVLNTNETEVNYISTDTKNTENGSNGGDVPKESTENTLKNNSLPNSNIDFEISSESKLATDLPSLLDNVSDNDEANKQTKMTPIRITKVSPHKAKEQTKITPVRISKCSPHKSNVEQHKEKPVTPPLSHDCIQNISKEEDKTISNTSQTTKSNSSSLFHPLRFLNKLTEWNSQSSSSKFDVSQESKSLEDLHTGNNEETGQKSHRPSKRKRSCSTDSLASVQDNDAAVKETQKRPKRSTRSSSCEPHFKLAEKEANFSSCTKKPEININNKQNGGAAPENKLDFHVEVKGGDLNGLKFNKKPEVEENSEFSSNNNQLSPGNHSVKDVNVESSPIYDCQVKLTPLNTKYLNCEHVNKNRSQTNRSEEKVIRKSINSTEKKVWFSPEATFNFIDGKKHSVKFIPISGSDSENKNSIRKLEYPPEARCTSKSSQVDDLTRLQSPLNFDGDNKKQTSILKYFGQVKKVEDKQVSSRGILLRSNRRSAVNSYLPGLESKANDLVPIINSPSRKNARKESAGKKSVESKGTMKASSPKRNKTKSKVCTPEQVEKPDSWNSNSSPVKSCFVRLRKLDLNYALNVEIVDSEQLQEPFIGWDWNVDELEFLGFDFAEENLFFGFQDQPDSSKEILLIKDVINNMTKNL